jgi:transcriptional regulator with XRE-family HTH domain
MKTAIPSGSLLLRKARLRARQDGITDKELAKRIGKTPEYLSKLFSMVNKKTPIHLTLSTQMLIQLYITSPKPD